MSNSKKTKATDSSLKVYQGEKIKIDLKIRDFNWTEKQKRFIDLAKDKSAKLIFVSGPAGSGKSLLATYVGLLLLNERKASDIIYLRSAVESSDSKLGFLPGTADEKMSFYSEPFMDKLEEILPIGNVKSLVDGGHVYSYPINFARGKSWNAKVLIADEIQNSSTKEIITLITRMGQYTKTFILADPMQSDLPESKQGGFDKIVNALTIDKEAAEQHGIFKFEFSEEDIMRSEIVKFIVSKTKNLK